MLKLHFLFFCFLIVCSTTGSYASHPVQLPVSMLSGKDNSQLKTSSSKVQKIDLRAIRRLIHKQIETEKTELALLLILSVLVPPLAVFLKERQINSRFWLSLLLTLLFWLPGVIYSILVILAPNQA